MSFRYFVLSLQNTDNLRLCVFVFSPRNNDKTTRNNEINKALISEIFCSAIYRLLTTYM